MLRPGFFRREVEQTLRAIGAALVLSAFMVTLGWGYQQKQQAQAWRDQACTYRFADVPRTGVTVSRGMTHDGIGKYLS